MDVSNVAQRWGFLAPWCQVLQRNVHYTGFKCEGTGKESWESKARSLQVTLPKRNDYLRPHLQHEATYQLELVKIREALAILAAVARVDHFGWKWLLATQCQLNWWKQGEENFPEHLPARFVLKLEDHSKVTADLVKFCGVDQRVQPSAEYVETMKRIAEIGGYLTPDSPGVDVEVPVKVAYGAGQKDTKVDGYQDQLLKGLTGVARAEKAIRREWERYFKAEGSKEVARGSLRCTFALEPMIADVQVVQSIAKTAGTLERLLFNNVWFSLLSVRAKCAEGDQAASLIAFRQLMIAVFDGARRGPELSNTKYRSLASSAKPLQLGSLVLHNDLALDPLETEALFSAAVLNQTTQKLSVWVDLMSHDQPKTNFWWKWLAYGCFSKRARTHSALQSLDLGHVGSISIADVETFLAIVDSEHPEELLFDCPRGSVEGREATLKDGAMVQYDITANAQPRSLTFTSCRFLLHTFGDDGSSEWVNVIVPGFGRCRVRRSDLVLKPVRNAASKRSALTSLTLRLHATAISNGLPRFLAAIGSSLQYLAIENPGETVDPSVILRCCPNLRELTVNRGLMDVQFKFDSGVPSQTFSTLRLDWENVAGLATTLSNTSNPLAKCVNQLRVRLPTSIEADNREYELQLVRRSLETLLVMLNANKYLEYLEVNAPSEHQNYLAGFLRHHHEVIGHKLNVEARLALLSVVPDQRKNPNKKLCTTSGPRRLMRDMDQETFAKIFAFAAQPVTRRVCFHA
ncbi:hypothetical protein JG687_00014087 [Phytophthora cactorum]|uniref:Uncharacterized protein n=1 Tax=Phytophthora cactorum TaxID=29920 RepID=A0A8T1U0R9_9STRA|nr:hypothetical protein PC120_g15235 [Phytophthora cactorum]KAG3082741.1 hypothetical protein PC121_g5967 [Phytophthora cactorum]KAG3175394.1 hypothetical protein PC128_g17753 [Phytophthora cactorum]KAG4049390.1 hypothetical protein PC123_g15328 [Phytophthora cactorum]KAG6950701.1 hypothetical protein JG687_00014087 [Phytophthora cactorum]